MILFFFHVRRGVSSVTWARTNGRVHEGGEAPGGAVVAGEDAMELLVAGEMQEGGATERRAAEADGRQVFVLLCYGGGWVVGWVTCVCMCVCVCGGG